MKKYWSEITLSNGKQITYRIIEDLDGSTTVETLDGIELTEEEADELANLI